MAATVPDPLSAGRERLRRLEQLRAEGFLTDEEYAAKRAAIVDDVIAVPLSNAPHPVSGNLLHFPGTGANAPASSRLASTTQYAGFWSRAGAFLVDCVFYPLAGVLFMGVGALLGEIFFSVRDRAWPDLGLMAGVYFAPIFWWISPFWISVAIAAGTYVEAVGKGETFGSGAFGLRIVRVADGRPPGSGWALVRVIVSLFSRAVVWLGYLWMVWDDKHQTWHDKVAGTMVVRAPRGESS